MGCLCVKSSKRKESTETSNKIYSWDLKRLNFDPNDLCVEHLEASEVRKIPNSINGQQFIVRNCRSSTILLLDHINTLTIDDCTDCKFIIGPVRGSVFLRDCKDSVCVVACGQFRMRDCLNVTVFLCCSTQPIIESSRRIHFGCYQLFYCQLEDQFKSAELNVFNNSWNSVHDFTPTPGETNWSLLPTSRSAADYIDFLDNDFLGVSFESSLSVVPPTGLCPVDIGQDLQLCLVVFFHHGNQKSEAISFIRIFTEVSSQCRVLCCRQVLLELREADILFQDSRFHKRVQAGPLIGLVLAGPLPLVLHRCAQTVEKTVTLESRDMVYVTIDPATATVQSERFISIAAMVMAL